eukprot:3872340-Rhodomonas_salina.8
MSALSSQVVTSILQATIASSAPYSMSFTPPKPCPLHQEPDEEETRSVPEGLTVPQNAYQTDIPQRCQYRASNYHPVSVPGIA